MNIIFLTLCAIDSIYDRNIYMDLLREFISNHHNVYVVSPSECRNHESTHLIEEDKCRILKVRVGSIQKTNIIEKGISTILLGVQYRAAIKKYFGSTKFDLILYSTPPITLVSVVDHLKTLNNAKTYLLLKDIFPQNAVDLGMMTKKGIKSLIYRYFRGKEKKLYAMSDHIGCMSEANMTYLSKHNPEIHRARIGLCVNSIVPSKAFENNKSVLRRRYGLPEDAIVFFFGGNFGKPQGIDYIVSILRDNADKPDRYFVLCGMGTEMHKIQKYINFMSPTNIILIDGLLKDKYDELLRACDVGLVFLDHRFTIPNFPSRILPYMEYSMPILAATDENTDLGTKIVENDFGWWCESKEPEAFDEIINLICTDRGMIIEKGKRARIYLENNYTSDISYNSIMNCYNS